MTMKTANAYIAPLLLAPLFEQALADRTITVWVCASDITAFDALSFLDKKHIRVPDQLSVVGFDNIPLLTASRRLTSFDFNAPGFAYRMLDFIVRPPKARGLYRHVPIEVEGSIMMRGSTGKARLGQIADLR
jgi:DNA-binding LacI/PurR family transcriptional regulator